VRSEIALRSGLSITIEGQPAQGSKHEVLFGILRDTGEAVVVKLERVSGALARESAALEYLAARGGPVPELRAIGLTDVAGERVPCLVVRPGGRGADQPGWVAANGASAWAPRRTGERHRTAARFDCERFGDEHAQRVRELGDCLTAIVAAVPDWPSLASAEIPVPGPLVLTHGDPGPGNFLDDGRSGWLIDWEDAHVAPRGLDLARVAFIACLGSGPVGFVGRDYDARARAAVAGYLQTVPGGWQPSVEETRWWFAVAGVQFIHHRWRLGGWPAPWEEAAAVVQRGLMDTVAWGGTGETL
jgi:aminoglycoside phosphotransferase